MSKDKTKSDAFQERFQKVCPTFSLDESLKNYLRENDIQLSAACFNRVKNLCLTTFVSNPAEKNKKFFVNEFTTGRTETVNAKWVDKRGICKYFCI